MNRMLATALVMIGLVSAAACGSKGASHPRDSGGGGSATDGAGGGSAVDGGGGGSATPDGGDGGGAVKAPPQSDDTADRKTAAQAIVAAGTSCVPADPPAPPDGSDQPTPSRNLVMAQVGTGLVACLEEHGYGMPFVGVLACWDVDPATAALTYRDPAPLPGVGVSAVPDKNGCIYGYCVADLTKPEVTADIAWNTTGDLVAVAPRGLEGGEGAKSLIHVFDAKTKKLLRSVDLYDNHGLSNSYAGMVFVKDVLFVTGTDAGPWASVWAFSAGDQPLAATDGLVHDIEGEKDPYGSVYSGTVAVLDDHRALIGETGATSIAVADVATHQVAAVARKGLPCTDQEINEWETTGETKPKKKCQKFLDSDISPMIGASIVSTASGNYLAMTGGGTLYALDAKKLTLKKQKSLPRCK